MGSIADSKSARRGSSPRRPANKPSGTTYPAGPLPDALSRRAFRPTPLRGSACFAFVGYPSPVFTRVDAQGFTVYSCPLCGGSSHPATGCVYAPGFVVCWPCTLAWRAHIVAWQKSKGARKGPRFYDHVRRVALPIGPPSAASSGRGRGLWVAALSHPRPPRPAHQPEPPRRIGAGDGADGGAAATVRRFRRVHPSATRARVSHASQDSASHVVSQLSSLSSSSARWTSAASRSKSARSYPSVHPRSFADEHGTQNASPLAVVVWTGPPQVRQSGSRALTVSPRASGGSLPRDPRLAAGGALRDARRPRGTRCCGDCPGRCADSSGRA